MGLLHYYCTVEIADVKKQWTFVANIANILSKKKKKVSYHRPCIYI